MPKLLYDYNAKTLSQFFNDKDVYKEMCRVISTRCGSAGGGTPITTVNYDGGEQVFIADGVETVVTITHNMNLVSSGDGQYRPKSYSLTTSEPIPNNLLTRTVTFPTPNTMVLTFPIAPSVGEDANYYWTILR